MRLDSLAYIKLLSYKVTKVTKKEVIHMTEKYNYREH